MVFEFDDAPNTLSIMPCDDGAFITEAFSRVDFDVFAGEAIFSAGLFFATTLRTAFLLALAVFEDDFFLDADLLDADFLFLGADFLGEDLLDARGATLDTCFLGLDLSAPFFVADFLLMPFADDFFAAPFLVGFLAAAFFARFAILWLLPHSNLASL